MTTSHQHSWHIRSTHPSSEGLVIYQGCVCGRHRILLADNDSAGIVQAHGPRP